MTSSTEEQLNQKPFSEDPITEDLSGRYKEDEDLEEEEDEEEVVTETSRMISDQNKLKNFIHRLSKERVNLRVHDVIIEGNIKTKESFIEAEVEILKNATCMQELLQAANIVNERLESLEIFDAVHITFDSGPAELPGTANVTVKVVEPKNPVVGNVGIFSKPETRSWSLEGSVKFRNLFGYGDIWEALGAYGWDQATEVSLGVSLPRFKRLSTPTSAKVSVFTQDWLKLSSYKERMMGLSLDLYTTQNHNLSYNLGWRTLTDPSQMASRSVRDQLGHSLISSLKYRFLIDKRDSSLRPTRGYAFSSITQLTGLTPDSRSPRFIRQEFDFRFALPLGFYNAALNFGVSLGALFPWGSGYTNKSSPLPDRFFLGGQSSAVCTLGGPSSLLGFKPRGVGLTEERRKILNSEDDDGSRDVLGGDLALTAYADLSFNLPLKALRDAGIHGHAFASTGTVSKLGLNEIRNSGKSFRTSVGAGVIIPTNVFRMEINYCYIVKKLEHDSGKTGIQFNFSMPSF
ncbi:hypothetical protein ACHQM5_023429 [Ranunculus cassubicifolius]